jgi:hypothetical protein
MAMILVKGAIIQCTHGGQLKLGTGDSRLTVDGNGAVTFGMEAGLTFGSAAVSVPGMISPCSAVVPATGQPQPCVTAPAIAGQATKLTVGNIPVLLDSAQGTTVSGAGPGTWSVSSAGQSKLDSA